MSERSVDDALLTLAFAIKSNPGAYAVLIGAGVSAGSGVATAWGVLEDLIGRVAQIEGVDDLADPVDWYWQTYGEEPRYETLLEKIAPKPLERQRLLRNYFEPTPEEVEAGLKAPTLAHHAIARMAQAGFVQVIVTLNFDRLIEQALRAAGVEPTVIASPADIRGMAPLHTITCCVIHLHGDYLNPESMRNTTSELGEYDQSTSRLLTRVLEDYGLIIAGWSSKHDRALRTSIASQYSPARQTLVWIEPGPESDTAAELRTLKNGLLFTSDADRAFGRLADAVDALALRSAAHPLTVAVAVGTAKRELSGRAVAITLHDTLNRELDRLHNLPDFHPPNYHDDAPYGGHEAMLGRVEEASRLACALVATLAYWGDADTDQWWIDEVHRFTLHSNTGGLTRLIRLKLITGSALLYSAGVAAVSAHRFDLLAKLLTSSGSTWNSSERLLDADLLDPSGVYAVGNGARRGYEFVAPLLREALAINDKALDEAWQRFEVLRLAVVTMRRKAFPARLKDFLAADSAVAKAERALAAAELSQDRVNEAQARVNDTNQQRHQTLDELAGLVRVTAPHLLASTGPTENRHRVPVADRLADDLAAEGENHELIQAGLHDQPTHLRAALLSVSVAGGLRGEASAFRLAVAHGGIVVDEIWLDSDMTPEEVRQASAAQRPPA